MLKTRDHKSLLPGQPTRADRQCLAWQGFELRVPREWNAVKIEGDSRAGLILLADLESARLGLRWATVPRSKQSNEAIVRHAMREEVGELAAKESHSLAPPTAAGFSSHLLFEDQEPPGRDVWIGLSDGSKRLVQLTYQARTRDRVLARDLLPTLTEQLNTGIQRWAVLDLSCEVPSGFELRAHQLSAGDLRLSFAAAGRQRIGVRQIGPAKLALARQPLEKWLAAEVAGYRKLYRSSDAIESRTEGFAAGKRVVLERRRRAFLHRSSPARIVVAAFHDEGRNRIMLVQAGDDATAAAVARSIGWATQPGLGSRC